jgi:hypothetical protein
MAFEENSIIACSPHKTHSAAAEHTAQMGGISNQARMRRTGTSEQTHAPRSEFAVDGAGGET